MLPPESALTNITNTLSSQGKVPGVVEVLAGGSLVVRTLGTAGKGLGTTETRLGVVGVAPSNSWGGGSVAKPAILL